MSETKKCPYCGEEIKAEAKKCRYCGEWLVPKDAAVPTMSTETEVASTVLDIENVEITVEKPKEKTAEELLKMMIMPSDLQSLCNEGKYWKAITTLEKKKGRMPESEYDCVLAHIFILKMLKNGNYDDYKRVEELLNEATCSGPSERIRTSLNVGGQALQKIYRDHLMSQEEKEEEEIKLAMSMDNNFMKKYNYYSTFANRLNFLHNGKDMVASADPRATANPHWAEVRTKHQLGKSDIPLFVRYRSSTDTFAITSRGVSHFNKDKGFELQKLSWKDIERVEHIGGQVVFYPSDENYTVNNLKVDDYDLAKFSDNATINRFIKTFMGIRNELIRKKTISKSTPIQTERTVTTTIQPQKTAEPSQMVQQQAPQSIAIQTDKSDTQAIQRLQEQTLTPEETSRCLARYGLESLAENEEFKPLIPIIVEMARMDEVMDDFVAQASKVDEAIQEFKGQVYDVAYDIFNESTKLKNQKMQTAGMAAAGLVAAGGWAVAQWKEMKNQQRQAEREEALMEMKQKMARVKDPNIVALHDMIVKRLPQLQKLYDKELSKSYLPTDQLLDKKVYAFKLTFFLYGKMLYMEDLSGYFHRMFTKWKEKDTLDDMPPLQDDTLLSLISEWDANVTMKYLQNGKADEQFPVHTLLAVYDPFILQNHVGDKFLENWEYYSNCSSAISKKMSRNACYGNLKYCFSVQPEDNKLEKSLIPGAIATVVLFIACYVIIFVLEWLVSLFTDVYWRTPIVLTIFFIISLALGALFGWGDATEKYDKEVEKWQGKFKTFDFKLNNKKSNKK